MHRYVPRIGILKLWKWIGMARILYTFTKKVKNNGAWDLKRKKKWQPKTYKAKYFKYYRYKKIEAQDVGNIHFGYVGAVLFSRTTLCAGAGMYQIYSRNSKWKYIKTFFDDPRDNKFIKVGYKQWKKKYRKRVVSW